MDTRTAKNKLGTITSVLMATLACATLACGGSPQDEPRVDPEALAAAQQALETLIELTDEDNYAEMGFGSLPQFDHLALGTPIPVHYISLDDLREHDVSLDPHQIIVNGDEELFPVEVDGQVRTSVVVKLEGGQWSPTSYGDASYVQAIDEVRREHALDTGRGHHEYFMIVIPGMHHTFIAHYDDEDSLHLTTIFDHEHLTIGAGETDAAAAIVEALTEAAQTFPLPPPPPGV